MCQERGVGEFTVEVEAKHALFISKAGLIR